MIFEQHTTARYSLTCARLSARPIFCGHTRWICGRYFACAGYARLYAWLGTRSVATSRETTRHYVLSMCAKTHEYMPSVLRPAVYSAATPRMACRVH
jgi:hypothetical protein